MTVNETQQTFATAYEKFSDSIFRHCYIRVSDREEAIDLTQEAFMRTWDYLRKGNKIKNLKAFLFQTLNNLIIDWYRKKKSVPLEDEFASQIPDEHHSKDPYVESEGKWALSLLDMLDEKHRTVVELRLVEDWSPKEIAALLGESENAVSVRIHRGIGLLKSFVESKNYKNHD